MSFLLRRTSRSAVVAARPISIVTTRGFRGTEARLSKESDLGTDSAHQSEIHKQDLLRKQKEGKGHWKPELASDSEEAVAADRHKHSGHETETLEELQKRTAQHAEKKHKYIFLLGVIY
ncbi:hypothetical protein OIDMADRAFT_29099 [Oidiodendron maius Zn]|uniref:Uncharacterized protein n=1 Tax=Oidiodendron maius (strain Zn) TaxID=913774 RepID=A0A0C3HE07_OIDMZ|nr:hypothetical protein OIDMADRAFT_29099 [Oidiodendron maius Zn]